MYYICEGVETVNIIGTKYGPTGTIGQDRSVAFQVHKGEAIECQEMHFPTYFREAINAEIVCIYGGKIPCINVNDIYVSSLQIVKEMDFQMIEFKLAWRL